jgi:hypothetical protein
MKYTSNKPRNNPLSYLLVFFMAAGASSLLLSPSPAYAETPVDITCKDGKTVTAIRTSEAFTLEDYQEACKDHGGYEDTGPYIDDGSGDDGSAGNTLQTGSTGGTGDGKKCTASFFGIPAWYKNMQDDSCAFKAPESGGQPDVRKTVLMIALNVIQAGMVIVGYVAVFFLISGGFRYITSAGSSDGMAAAKKTITNALVGLVIAILAASIVNAIAGVIK